MNPRRIHGWIAQLVSGLAHFFAQEFQVEIHEMADQHRALHELAKIFEALPGCSPPSTSSDRSRWMTTLSAGTGTPGFTTR